MKDLRIASCLTAELAGFHFDAPVPHLFVLASRAKNKRKNCTPLPAHLVAELRAYFAKKIRETKGIARAQACGVHAPARHEGRPRRRASRC